MVEYAKFFRLRLARIPVIILGCLLVLLSTADICAQSLDTGRALDKKPSTLKRPQVVDEKKPRVVSDDIVSSDIVTSEKVTSEKVTSDKVSSDIVEIEDTITGNQEQPKVLYIVPWRPAQDNTILNQPLKTRMNNIFDHVEREELQRQIRLAPDTQKVD